MKVSRAIPSFAALVLAFATPVLADPTIQLPKFSGGLPGYFATPSGNPQYIYLLTQYGFARLSLTDPSNPSNPLLMQVGQKYTGGISNGGVVGMDCDCWQGGTSMDAAEDGSGNSRMVSDWIAAGQGLNAEVALGSSGGVSFGQQIDIDSVPLGSRVAAISLPSGKYVGYFPYTSGSHQGGVAVVDLTTTTGSGSRNQGIHQFSSLAWGSGTKAILKAAAVGGKYLLVGGIASESKIRIAEIDPTTGIPTETDNIASASGNVVSISLATVEGRIFVFTAEGTSGVRAYEYSAGKLQPAVVLPGNYNEVVVRGGALPILLALNVVSFTESYVEAWDTNWITRGGSPRRGGRLRHGGAPENFVGKFDGRVVGNTVYVYRVDPTGVAGQEYSVQTTPLDITSLTVDPNSPPIASSVAVNLSAGARVGAERAINYYGDKWEIQDASASATTPPANGLDHIEWDWNYTTLFAADTGWTALTYNAQTSDIKPAYFPCNPTGGGDIQTSVGCATSLGVTNPPTTASYRYAVRTKNSVNWSTPSVSPSITVVTPLAKIVGFDGTNLQVLTGQGQADAGISQGNINDPLTKFNWTFSPSGTSTLQKAPVPIGSKSFSLTITYPGGYTAVIQKGNISEVDLVPEFSPAQGTLSVGGNLTITNNMQKSAAVTLVSVEYSWNAGTTYTALASSFNTAGGTAAVPAPALGTGYNLKLRYNYTKGGTPASVTVSHGPYTVTNSLVVSVSGPASGKTGTSITFTATVTGATSPTFSWCWDGCSLGGVFVAGTATQAHTFTTAGTRTIVAKVDDGGRTGTATWSISITGGTTSGFKVTLSAPATGVVNQPVNFSASASGGSAPYTYSWCWDGCSLGGTFEAGPASNSHTYTSAGTRTLTVRATDSASKSVTDTRQITINTGGGGGGTVTVTLSAPSTGQTNQAISFTASATGGTGSYSYSWCWDGCSLGGTFLAGPATNSHTFTTPGTRSVSVRADSGSQSALATASIVIGGSPGKPVPNGSYTVVSGADINPFNGAYEAEAGKPITLSAVETNAAGYAWDFGDGTSGTGKTVSKSFTSQGTFTIRLTVTGDGTNTAGTSSSSQKFSVGAAKFSAVVVPDASHIDMADGSWKTDVTVTNSGTTPLTITPLYKSYDSLIPPPPSTSIDVTALGFDAQTKYTILPGGSWSQSDVVGFLGGTGKGDLFIQTDGGPSPDVSARVYFAPTDPEKGSYGNAVSAFPIGAFGPVGVQQIRASSPQTLLGVRSDDQYRFKVKLYNSSGALNGFRLTAFDETGAAVALNGSADLQIAVGPYASAELSDEVLGLTDATHHYVLKAEPVTTGAMLLASASIIDRVTNDLVQISDDASRPTAAGQTVTAWVPSVSRFDTSSAHWRTSVSLLNSGSAVRGVLVEYLYGVDKVAQAFNAMNPGQVLNYDDITDLFPGVPEIAAEAGSAGLLRVSYPADAETPTNPVYVSARTFDDRSATSGGTAGTALETFASSDGVSAGHFIVIPGAEQNDRFRTNAGLFALDDGETHANVSALDKDGNLIGAPVAITLNQSGVIGHWTQFGLKVIPDLPAEAFSLRVDVVQGRVAAYAINVDQKSNDSTFIKGDQ